MNDFDSLAAALQGLFRSALADLPAALQSRVAEHFPVAWDQLSEEQRRSFANFWDSANDPALEAARAEGWNRYARAEELREEIHRWETVPVPTALDMAAQERKLRELRLELSRLEQPDDYVPYLEAMHELATRFGATPDELAAWVSLGPTDGGLAAYVNTNELYPPVRFAFNASDGDVEGAGDYISPLMGCAFRRDELLHFSPRDRFITGRALIERWRAQPGVAPEAFVRARIRESRLIDLHPVFGLTRESAGDPRWPPMESGLFRLEEIEAIEAADFPGGPVPVDAVDEVEAMAAVDVALVEPTCRSQAAALGDPLSVFRDMARLDASEVTMTLVGPRESTGLAANGLLAVSARGEMRRIPLASLELIDRRRPSINKQGAMLVGLCDRNTVPSGGASQGKAVSRLSKSLRDLLGMASPFESHRKGVGWRPRFSIIDARGAADERAACDAKRRTVSLDDVPEIGALPAFGDEVDEAGQWLSANDRAPRS